LLQFLQPIWLWGLTGIVVPVVIHLWNIKQGKVLRVGSIIFMQESPQKQSRNIKISDWLLLLLRCLLIILAALLLAGPVLIQTAKRNTQGWILIPKAEINEAYNNYKQLIDSLTAKGYQFHYFTKGFPEANLKEALDRDSTAEVDTDGYWQQLVLLDKSSSPAIPKYLFTRNALQKFEGSRPVISHHLQWLTYTTKDSLFDTIPAAFLTNTGNAGLLAIHSTPFSNSYQTKDAAGMSLSQTTNGTALQLKNGTILPLDTATLTVAIYTGKNGKDAGYIKAALASIQQYTQRKLSVTTVSSVAAVPAKAKWLFWLSEDALPQSVQYEQVFLYQQGKETSVNSVVQTGQYVISNEQNIGLFKRISFDSSGKNSTLWTDGFGNPLLTRSTLSNGKMAYRFYSRFNPSWNDLSWSAVFPSLLLTLMYHDINLNDYTDKRVIDQHQYLPRVLPEKNISKTQYKTTRSLTNIGWWIAFIVLCMERVFSFMPKKQAVI